jgi:phospholipid/cholesterol/gamma-HCH transport system ATP-binding protein
LIEFRGIHKNFGAKVILSGVDLTVQSGEILFVVGTSGVGKSVLIKHAVGLLAPDRGTVLVDGVQVTGKTERELSEIRKKCAMVFQHATLFDSMTCAENVALPLRKHGSLSREQALGRAHELLQSVEMADAAQRYPGPLGDGQRKRVAVARALALSPRYVLFDEPTTSLDPVSARRIDRLIGTLAAQHGVTCVVVSHDLKSIFTIADRIAMLYKGEVKLLGTREDFRKSPDPVVQQFITGNPSGPMETT